jgi:tRNA-Thr(GGU) m(6)t(6)A37 methyltransferase TsaA
VESAKFMNYEVIGCFHCSKVNPYEAARQGSVDTTSVSEANEGFIELLPGKNFEQALDQLEKFSHLWIVFDFHLNKNWKPKVLPPRGSQNKVGVFATRSPHRPNSIGMSAVKLIKVEGLKIFVQNFDLLDQTPILDIKPYLAYADSIPEANQGWIESQSFQIEWGEKAREQIAFLKSHGLSELSGFIQNQLSEDPLNHKKKRVQASPLEPDIYILAYRTWRIAFHVLEQTSIIDEIYSGYSRLELESDVDTYNDKNLHRLFIQNFNRTCLHY